MKPDLSFVVALYVVGVFMLLSGFLVLEPLLSATKIADKVKWDDSKIVATIIPLILGGGSFYLFSKRNLEPSHIKLRKIAGAVVVVFYTTIVAYAIVYPYVEPGEPDRDRYIAYAKGLALTVLPGTLVAAGGFVFPRKEKSS